MEADPTPAAQEASGEAPWLRLLSMLGATSLAVAQPLLSSLGENPAVFESLNITGVALVLFVVGLVVLPPILLWVFAEAVRLADERLGGWLYLSMVSALLLSFVLQLFVRLGVSGLALPVLAVPPAALFMTWYCRDRRARTWVRVLAALGAVSLVSFWGSDAGALFDPEPLQAVELETNEPLPDLFILVLDELPTATLLDDDARIDVERFPNLAAFAETATWYRGHTSVSPFTEFALPTLLTGQDPVEASPFAAQYPDNLFTLFGSSHRLRVSEALTGLCGVPACDRDLNVAEPDSLGDEVTREDPRQWRSLLDTSWSLFRQKVGVGDNDGLLDDFQEQVVTAAPPTPTTVPGAEPATTSTFPPELERFLATRLGSQPTRFSDFVDSLDSTGDPMLGFLHLILPHQPWEFYPDGTQYRVDEQFDQRVETFAHPWMLRVTEARHVAQTRYADGLVGEFLAALVSVDRFDEAAIVVVGDHGIDFELGTHPRQISDPTIDGVVYSPLLIKAPGQTTGTTSDANVMSIDLVPVIADLLAVEVPWELDGVVPGSAGSVDRGGEKFYGDFVDPFDPVLNGIIAFDAQEIWQRVLLDRNHELYRDVAAASLLGTVPAVVDADPIGVVLDGSPLVPRGEDELPYGVVSGVLDAAQTDDTVALLVGGTIVSLSPVFDNGSAATAFALWVPPEHAGVTAELAVLRDGQAYDIVVR